MADDPTELTLNGDTAAAERVHPSRLDDEGKMLVFKQWFRDDSRHSSKWRDEAKQDFDFVAGDQWTPEDQQALKNQMRPAIVFNRALTIIKCVAGMEINSRHEINYLPRNTEAMNANKSELLTGTSKWMADECDGEDEESDGFQKSCICGMGWTEHRLSYEEDPAGKYIEESIDPLEMYWDAHAKKKNLTDARRLWRVRKVPLGDAMELFPDKSRAELDAAWALNEGPEEPQKTLEERRVRDENTSAQWADQDNVTLICLQWIERQPYWRVADAQTNKISQLDDAQFEELKNRLAEFKIPPPKAVRMMRKVYYQAFIGNVLLKEMAAPIPDRFSWVAQTGEIHHNKGTFFGLVRVMRDPQMWSNKWLSQSLHILNTTAKGGILAEKDAFEDQGQAEATYAKPDAITWVEKGSLSTPHGPKVIPKPGSSFPTGHMQLMELAITALRDVTGINYELLGLKDINQPGILEAQRKQAGMTVLATMFDSLRRARKEIGRIRLYYIQNFLSDGRIIRIVGKDGAQAVPLIRDQCTGDYDVVVQDAPASPNQKEANWATILSILPAFKDQLMSRPDLLAIILEYSPFPQRLVDAIKAALASPSPQLQQQQQLAQEAAIAKINKDQSTAEMQNAKAGATQATALYDIAMAKNLLLKHGLDGMAAYLDAAHKGAQIQHVQAQTDHVKAQTMGQHVATGVDAMTPIPHEPPNQSPAE